MSNKGQLAPEIFIGLMILVIVGLPFVYSVTSDLSGDFTDETDVTNETHTVTSVPSTVTVDISDEEHVKAGSETIFLANSSSTTLTLGTNYTVLSTEDGQYNITDLAGVTNGNRVETLGFDYTKRNDLYKTDNTEKTLIDLLPLFILVILILGIISVTGLL